MLHEQSKLGWLSRIAPQTPVLSSAAPAGAVRSAPALVRVPPAGAVRSRRTSARCYLSSSRECFSRAPKPSRHNILATESSRCGSAADVRLRAISRPAGVSCQSPRTGHQTSPCPMSARSPRRAVRSGNDARSASATVDALLSSIRASAVSRRSSRVMIAALSTGRDRRWPASPSPPPLTGQAGERAAATSGDTRGAGCVAGDESRIGCIASEVDLVPQACGQPRCRSRRIARPKLVECGLLTHPRHLGYQSMPSLARVSVSRHVTRATGSLGPGSRP